VREKRNHLAKGGASFECVSQGCSTLFSESLMQQVPGIEARRAREDSAG
jgi:hypothetical protein